MTKNFEDFLAYHFTNVEYHGPKDCLEHSFECWIEKLDIDDFFRLADLYASEIAKEQRKAINEAYDHLRDGQATLAMNVIEKALGL